MRYCGICGEPKRTPKGKVIRRREAAVVEATG